MPAIANSITTPTPTSNPNALTVWPSGKAGYTNVLESLPLTAGRDLDELVNTVARTRSEENEQRG